MGTADALFLVDEGEDENMPWYWESGDLAAEFPERFEILRVSLDMECRGAVTLAVSRDEEPFEVQWTAQTAGKRTTLVCPLVTEPEHSFRVRLEGTGPMKLYAMQLRFKAATEVEDG